MAGYMKKWWLQADLTGFNGEPLQFRGWVCTVHDSKEGIPDQLYGKFLGWKDEKGMHGRFELDDPKLQELYVQHGMDGDAWNFLFGSCYPNGPMPDHANLAAQLVVDPRYWAECVIGRTVPVSGPWPRFDLRLEDHIVPERTYVESM